MDVYDIIFLAANIAVVPGWILLVVFPRRKFTNAIVFSGVIPFLLGVTYIMLFIVHFGRGSGNFMSLEGVMQLFGNRHAVLAGWLHYLAFDLWVGGWITRDAGKYSIHHAFIVPCLLTTLMAGPLGLCLYLIIRLIVRKKLLPENIE